MSKTIKNVLLGFTLLCVIILIIFTVELIVLNRNSGAAGNSGNRSISSGISTPSGASAVADGIDQALQSSAGSDSTPDQNESSPGASSAQSTGKRYKLLYSVAESLILYADEELFEYDDTNGSDSVFTYTGGGDASLRVSFEGIPLGVEKCAESLLDKYLDGNESSVGDMGQILHSSLSGVFVTGVNDGETFEAWVNGIADNDIGVAFVIRYHTDEQKNALYAVLDTLSLVQN